MSYSQFGYTYPASSQLVVGQSSGGGSGGEGYDTRVLSFPFGLYAPSSYPHETHFYTTLPSPFDLKESRGSWSTLQQSTAACYPYDPNGLASYPDRYGSMDSVARRKNATRETTNTLKAWLYEHRKNPYPTKGEKIMLAIITKMTLTQVSTWFANARRRLKKENKMTWEPRNKTSEGDDRDSSSPAAKSDDSNLPDYMKPEPSPTDRKPDPAFSIDDCYRVRPISEDSGSGSPGYKDRPKIWSLARTATSDSPPASRRAVPDYPAKNCEDMKLAGCYGLYPDRKSNCPAPDCYKDCPGTSDMKYRDFSNRTGLKDCPLPNCYGDFPKDDKMSGRYGSFPDHKGPDSQFSSERTAGCYRQYPSGDEKDSSTGESSKNPLCFREYDGPSDCYRDSGSDCPVKAYSTDYAPEATISPVKLSDGFLAGPCLAKPDSDAEACLESSGSSSCMLEVRSGGNPYDFPPIVDPVPEQQYFPLKGTAFKCHLEMAPQEEWPANQEGRNNER